MIAARFVFALLVLAAALQSVYYYPLLPEKIASHFGIDGTADGWSSKEGFFTLYWVLTGVFALSFVALPVWLRRLPESMINLPNKDYWLAPGRKDESMQYVTGMMAWMGSASMLLLLGMFQLTFQANLDGSFHLPVSTTWVVLGAYLAFMLLQIVRMYARFRKPADPLAGSV